MGIISHICYHYYRNYWKSFKKVDGNMLRVLDQTDIKSFN